MAKDTKITNCVVSCDTHSKFVLEQLAAKLSDAEYAPESFPGLVYRVAKPKASVLVFSTGKLICSGTKSLDEAKSAVKAALKNFREIGMTISDKLNTEVVNIVASSDL
ncbi:MAG: TATA-box-binding protein, partial [Candidatus Aenigmarchaeota archaeon]|nr:TATA-box-binding protein [Candidatus Aenigmarchaeota archaeon]